MVDYTNELLFFKGISLEMMTEEQMARKMTYRPVVLRAALSPPTEEEVDPNRDAPNRPRYAPEPSRGTEVLVYMPRTYESDKYVEITTKIQSTFAEEKRERYYVECFKGFPLEVMDEKRIKSECPSRAVIIAAEGAQLQPNDAVLVYMPYFKMTGTVVSVDKTRARKKYDVLYDYAESKQAGRTRFFAKALELWQKIPPGYEYPGQGPPLEPTAKDTMLSEQRHEESLDVSEKWKNFPTETKKTEEVRKHLEEKSVSLPYLCEMLSEHGVPDEKIPLYAWQVFPRGRNTVEYMTELVEKERPPLGVVAAYVGVLAKIKKKEQEKLEQQLEEAFHENNVIAVHNLLVKIGNPDNEQLKRQIYDLLSGRKHRKRSFTEQKQPDSSSPEHQEPQKLDYSIVGKLLELVENTTNADRLKEELAKPKPNQSRVQALKEKVKQDEVQLKLRQKPFNQWLEAMRTLVDGHGEYGYIGEWAGIFAQIDKEAKDRHDEMVDKVASMRSRTQAIWGSVTSQTTLEKIEQGTTKILESFRSPISIKAAFYKRLFAFVYTLLLSFFIVLAYSIFGRYQGDRFTLTVFVVVQASVFGVFYQQTTVDQLELETLKAALAYHVNCFRTVYDGKFQTDGQLCCDRYACCVACGCGSPRGDAKDNGRTGYHKWRAMALYKMIFDKKAELKS